MWLNCSLPNQTRDKSLIKFFCLAEISQTVFILRLYFHEAMHKVTKLSSQTVNVCTKVLEKSFLTHDHVIHGRMDLIRIDVIM